MNPRALWAAPTTRSLVNTMGTPCHILRPIRVSDITVPQQQQHFVSGFFLANLQQFQFQFYIHIYCIYREQYEIWSEPVPIWIWQFYISLIQFLLGAIWHAWPQIWLKTIRKALARSNQIDNIYVYFLFPSNVVSKQKNRMAIKWKYMTKWPNIGK